MEICANCGVELCGGYCHNCGQKRFDLRALTLLHFVRSALKDFTHFDVKIFRDLPALILRPGLLTAEYSQGKISRHVKPITMFLWLNVFFFLGGATWVIPQSKFWAGDHYWPGIQQRVLNLAAERGIPREQLIERYDHHLTHFEKYLFFFAVPTLAAPLLLLYRRRPDNFFAKHAVYSLHFWCAFFVYFACVPYVLRGGFFLVGLARGAPLHVVYDRIAASLFLVGVLLYHDLALRRVFDQQRLQTLAKAVLATALTAAVFKWGIGLAYLLAYWAVRA